MKYPDDYTDEVPPDKRGGVHAKPPMKEKRAHIPASHRAHPVTFTLPDFVVNYLFELYPDLSPSQAAKKYILRAYMKGDTPSDSNLPPLPVKGE